VKPGTKFSLHCEVRKDGGLRILSDIPGLVLSGPDPNLVLGDVWTAATVIYSFEEFGAPKQGVSSKRDIGARRPYGSPPPALTTKEQD